MRSRSGKNGDSAQNYHPKPPNPILNINYQRTKKWSYIRLSDLLKMDRATVNVRNPKTNQTNLYEGVALTQLVPNTSGYEIQVFRDSLAFKDNLAIRAPILTCSLGLFSRSSSELQAEVEP